MDDKEAIMDDVFKWLSNAKFWLGYLVGQDDFYFHNEDLKFYWYSKGIVIEWDWDKSHTHSFTNLGSFQVFGYEPFCFSYPGTIPKDEYFRDVELMIQKFLPGIGQQNTLAICESLESKHCNSHFGFITICKNLDGKRICYNCEEELRKPKYPGEIYLIGSKEYGLYKIGFSKNIKERFKSIKSGIPFDVEILHSIPSDDTQKAESKLHDLFAKKKSRGEWFKLTEEDINYIAKLISFNSGEFKVVTGDPTTFPLL